MGEEQKQILQMVADGKITADEGARLLEALEKGERKRKDFESPARLVREKKRLLREQARLMEESARAGHHKSLEGLRDIGRMVRNAVRGSIHGLDEDDFDRDFDESVEDGAMLLEDPLELEDGSHLIIKRALVRNASGSLFLSGNSGTTLEKMGDDSPQVMIRQDGDTTFVRWTAGDLNLSVPSTVKEVGVKLLGGDIAVNDLPASLRLKTKGGDIGLYEVSGDFSAKTMGGNVMIKLNEMWSGDSKASTMGGNISLDIAPSAKAVVSARTFGGQIRLSDVFEAEVKGGQTGSSEIVIDLSEGEEAHDITLSTMGGDISVEGSEDGSEKEDSRKKRRGRK